MKKITFGLFLILIINCSCISIRAFPDASGNFNTFEVSQTGHPTITYHDEGDRWQITCDKQTLYLYELDFPFTDRKPTLILPLQDELATRNIKIIGDAHFISIMNLQFICNTDSDGHPHCICLSCTRSIRDMLTQ